MNDVMILLLVIIVAGFFLAKYFVDRIVNDKVSKESKLKADYQKTMNDVTKQINEVDLKLKTKKEEYEKNKVIVYGLVDRINSRNKPGPK